MDYIKKFIENIKTIPLEKSKYEEIGLDSNFISTIIENYNLTKINDEHYPDEIIEFIVNYNPANLEIGTIRFFGSEQLIENDDYTIFGMFDSDSLAIDKSNKEIVVLDSNNENDSVLWYVSANQTKFMYSIIIAGKHLEQSVFDEKLNTQSLISSTAKICSDKAGGKKYLNFYLVLLGSCD